VFEVINDDGGRFDSLQGIRREVDRESSQPRLGCEQLSMIWARASASGDVPGGDVEFSCRR